MTRADHIGRQTACERTQTRYPYLHVIGVELERVLTADPAAKLPERLEAAVRHLQQSGI